MTFDQTVLDLVGYGAAALTTIAFLPQLITTVSTGNTQGLNPLMFVLFMAGVALWLVYGIAINSLPMIVANILTLAQASVILAYAIRNIRAEREAIPVGGQPAP